MDIELKQEQRDAINYDGKNIAVTASAGSGKTFVMIERILRLLKEKKTTVKEILAVTFTDKAAMEMKVRLKKELSKKVEETLDPYYSEQLRDVATADICTIDAFCSRLIREYFYVAEVSPEFSVLDKEGADLLKSKVIKKVFKEFYDTYDKDFISVANYYAQSRRDTDFGEKIIKISEYYSTEPDYNVQKTLEFFNDTAFDNILKEYREILVNRLSFYKEEVKGLIKQAEDIGFSQLKEILEKIAFIIDTVLNSENIYDIKRFNGENIRLTQAGKKDEVTTALKAKTAKLRDNVLDIVSTFNLYLNDYENDKADFFKTKSQIVPIINAVNKFEKLYTLEKQSDNLLDFNDLEKFTYKILQDEEARKAISDRYKYIFVDEYQDVNGLQEGIISRIAKDNLFMVGDEKQSIYGFRGCRPEIFRYKSDNVEKFGGKKIDLNFNFRSAKNVIDFVNKVFCYSMTEDVYGLNYQKTAQLKEGGIYPENASGRAELHYCEKEPPCKEQDTSAVKAEVYDILKNYDKENSSEDLLYVKNIVKIINDEFGKQYYDIKTKQFEQITYKDIVILTRAKNVGFVKNLATGLKKYGIPVTSEVKENICDYPEVNVLLSVLQIISCFSQDVPLAISLKSPLGKLTDEDLYTIRQFGKQNKSKSFYQAYRYYLSDGEGELKTKLQAFNGYIEKLRTVSDFKSVYEILNKIIVENDIESYYYATRGGEEKIKRIRQLLYFANKKETTVSEFLKTVKDLKEGITSEEKSGEEAVRIMTIHASKGLEFPVVIVAGLDKNASAREESDKIILTRDFGIVPRVYEEKTHTYKETVLRGLAREHLRINRIKEELRVFYVALTRASYSLHLTFENKKSSKDGDYNNAKKFLDYVPELQATKFDANEIPDSELSNGTRKVLIGIEDKEFTEKMKKNFAFTYEFAEDTSLPLKSSVSAVLEEPSDNKVYTLFDEDMPKTDKERGIIAHKFLELYNFGCDFESEKERIINTGAITIENLEKIDLNAIKNIVESPLFFGLKDCETYKEQEFIVNLPANTVFAVKTDSQILIQGIIDLLIMGSDGARIIDYKYSSLKKERLKEKYKKQLDLYAFATEKVLGIKVTKKTIVSLISGEYIDVD